MSLEMKDVIKANDYLKVTIIIKNLSTETTQSVTTEKYKLDKFEIQFKVIQVITNRYQGYMLYGISEKTNCADDFDIIISSPQWKNKLLLPCNKMWTELYELVIDGEIQMKLHVTCFEKNQDISTFKPIYEDTNLLDFKIKVKYTVDDDADDDYADSDNADKKVEESVSFHRAVLSAWSPVFLKMFTSTWKEKLEGVIELPVDIKVIKAFKKFVYKDELPTDRETLLALVELGSFFMVPKLELAAIHAIINITNTDNLFDTLEFSIGKKLHKLSANMLMETKSVNLDELVARLMTLET